MTTLQAICLGAMLAWTPSLGVLACLLREAPLDELSCDPSSRCSDYHYSHSTAISADRWPDHVRLSDLEPLFVCQACGTRPAELRPDFDWNRSQVGNVQRPHSMARHAP